MSDFHDPIECSDQAPLSMGFPRQEYWSKLPFPSPKSDFYKEDKTILRMMLKKTPEETGICE